MNTRRENTSRQLALLCLLLVWSQNASAHVLEGDAAGGFISGFEHPISGLDHIVAMVSVGLWGAQLGAPAIWLLPVTFPMVMAFGGMLGLMGVPLPYTEVGIAFSAIGLGAVVAAEARAEVDIRIAHAKDAATLDKKFRALRPFDKRCSIHVDGGLNRPPMERTPAIRQLFQTARECAKELGVALQESSTGGGSDGNFTAALGIPTLDGLGGVGEGAHAANESILLDRIADRTALLAMLLSRL